MSHKIIVARIARVEPIPNADKIQVGYVLGEPVVQELPQWKEKINSLFGREVFKAKMEYDYVVGTRNVVLKVK